jgi:thioredoxin-like negative regulator of GroEL
VPAKDKPTVLLFARLDQPTSREAMEQVKAASDKLNADVVLIFSGEVASASAKTLAGEGKYAWPIVVDPNFDASGKMGIHVWPTALVVTPNGEQVAHLAGVPPTFPADLNNYLEFAGGRIDPAQLQARLTTRETVTDTDEQKAARHLQVARRLIDAADIKGAAAEIESGLKLQPGNPDLLVLRARVLTLQGKAKDALDVLAKIPANALPSWQTSLAKAWALVALDKWDDAKAIIADAIKLNPQPADASYLAGLIYTHDKDFAKATEFFKKAYESTGDGRKLLSAQSAGAEK